jgi:uracil-DNA glycosylase
VSHFVIHQVLQPVHPSWKPLLEPLEDAISSTLSKVATGDYIPSIERIFAPLNSPLDEVKVVIVGQDPYPSADNADGYAFSVRPEVSPLPASLVNIFKELESDLGIPAPNNGNLERWSRQGVLLINRTLTTIPGESHSHQRSGWMEITEVIIREVASRGTVAILWGGNAQQMSDYFDDSLVIKSAHPSPLSAYRGFFGSKPFSRCNEMLEAMGKTRISW